MDEKQIELILEERKKWYSFVPALFEIAKAQHKRELAFINKLDDQYPFRYRFAFTVDRLKQIFDRLDFLRKTYNMYQSVGTLNDMPILTFSTISVKELKETPEYQDFHGNYRQKLFGFDIFFDIDGKEDPKKAYEDAKKLKYLLDSSKVPYYVLNSSDNGFHFRIPSQYIDNFDLDKFYNVIYNIKGIYMLSSLDDSVVDEKRLCKTPFSYECKSRTICLPLTDFEFENFSPEKVRVDYILRYIKIQNRGLLTRKHGLSDEELKNNVRKFIDTLSVV